jgi:hypothetical protein
VSGFPVLASRRASSSPGGHLVGAAARREVQRVDRFVEVSGRRLQSRQAQIGVGFADIDPHRIAVFLDRAAEVAELLGCDCGVVARHRAVGPLAHSLVEQPLRGGGVSARELDAPAQNRLVGRQLDLIDQRNRIVEAPRGDQRVGVSEQQLGAFGRIERARLLERFDRLAEVALLEIERGEPLPTPALGRPAPGALHQHATRLRRPRRAPARAAAARA